MKFLELYSCRDMSFKCVFNISFEPWDNANKWLILTAHRQLFSFTTEGSQPDTHLELLGKVSKTSGKDYMDFLHKQWRYDLSGPRISKGFIIRLVVNQLIQEDSMNGSDVGKRLSKFLCFGYFLNFHIQWVVTTLGLIFCILYIPQ